MSTVSHHRLRSFKIIWLKAMTVCLVFLFIGAVIAAFTLAGTIPTLLYMGLQCISPRAFLPIGLVLCSLMSLAIGTCWGTIGTMGVALMGLATLMHIPLPITAGMIISGAYFGDKLSPISDTTLLSAISTETPLYTHIKGMTYTIIPAYLLTLILFAIVGLLITPHDTLPLTTFTPLQQQLTHQFAIGWIALLPVVILLLLSLWKQPAIISMSMALITAIATAHYTQALPLTTIWHGLWFGPDLSITGFPTLQTSLQHGGMQPMLKPMSYTLLILMIGSTIAASHPFNHYMQRCIRWIQTPFQLVCMTLLTAVGCDLCLGEAYFSILLTARLYKPLYSGMRLNSCVLSKAIEEGSTFATPLIPWTTSGIFITSTLGISPIAYMGWSFFNWIAPTLFLCLAFRSFMGIPIYCSASTPS